MSFLKALFGPSSVEQLRAQGNIDGLIKALDDQKDAGVRQAAAKALGQMGAPQAVEPLIAALQDENPSVRESAAQALGQIGDRRGVEPLITALEDSNHGVRQAIVEVLGEIGDARALESLAVLRKERDRRMRTVTILSLLVTGVLILFWGVLGSVYLVRTTQRSTTYAGLPLPVTPTVLYPPPMTPTPTWAVATDSPPAPPALTPLPVVQPADSGTGVPGQTPTVTPSPTVVPTSVPLLPIGEDTLVFALLGTDEEQVPGSWRTDAIVLAFVEPEARRVELLSVPRDLWVYIPGRGHERINTVDIMGGLALLDQTFRYNLGVPVHHYVRMNFYGFARIVDALGGITVNVEQALEDRIPDPLSPTGWFDIALEEGYQHFDGQTALAYCRSRITTSDFDRSRRQRQILLALWQQAFTVETLGQAPELWAALSESFDTDLSVGEVIRLAQAMVGLDVQNVRSGNLGAAVEQWTTPEGAWVLLPHPDGIRQAILDLLSSSA